MAATLLMSLHGSAVRADGGQGFGLGPVLAFSPRDGWSVGWEAGANAFEFPVLKGSIGGIYALSERSEFSNIYYLAYEPWLYVGATLGIGVANGSEPRFVYGLWEGYPFALSGEVGGGTNGDQFHPQAWVLTLAMGWRGFGSTLQLYFTPKLWRFWTIELNS